MALRALILMTSSFSVILTCLLLLLEPAAVSATEEDFTKCFYDGYSHSSVGNLQGREPNGVRGKCYYCKAISKDGGGGKRCFPLFSLGNQKYRYYNDKDEPCDGVPATQATSNCSSGAFFEEAGNSIVKPKPTAAAAAGYSQENKAAVMKPGMRGNCYYCVAYFYKGSVDKDGFPKNEKYCTPLYASEDGGGYRYHNSEGELCEAAVRGGGAPNGCSEGSYFDLDRTILLSNPNALDIQECFVGKDKQPSGFYHVRDPQEGGGCYYCQNYVIKDQIDPITGFPFRSKKCFRIYEMLDLDKGGNEYIFYAYYPGKDPHKPECKLGKKETKQGCGDWKKTIEKTYK